MTMAAPVAFAEYVRDNDWTILNPLLMPGGITRPNLINADGYEAVIDLAVTDSPHLFTSMDCNGAVTYIHRSIQNEK